MRLRIIALFSFIVLAVGAAAWALSISAATAMTQADPNEAPRAAGGAVAQLEVEGLATERWLSLKAADPSMREAFLAGTPAARGDSATAVANKISDAAGNASELMGIRPSLVVLVDAAGTVLGRNGSSLMRGQDLAKAYPSLKAALDTGTTSSDVWVDRERNEQLLASYAPVRGEDGKVLGAVIFGSSLNDERLTSASDKTSGHALLFAVKGAKGLDVVAKSANADGPIAEAMGKAPASDAALQVLATGKSLDISGFPSGTTSIGRVLDGYGDGKRAVVVAVVQPAQRGLAMTLLYPALGAVVLGIILVAIAGFLLDAYISRPIREIEDGLLAIMNGQTQSRLEIEHAELGGVVFRINSLLNQLFGVAEDDTDEQGRPSRAPNPRTFNEALSVDESMAMSGGSAADSAELHAEAEAAYYTRVFNEYVQAKRSIGDPVDHISEGDFTARLQASEAEMQQKHGKPCRFKVELKGKEVVLLVVPAA